MVNPTSATNYVEAFEALPDATKSHLEDTAKKTVDVFNKHHGTNISVTDVKNVLNYDTSSLETNDKDFNQKVKGVLIKNISAMTTAKKLEQEKSEIVQDKTAILDLDLALWELTDSVVDAPENTTKILILSEQKDDEGRTLYTAAPHLKIIKEDGKYTFLEVKTRKDGTKEYIPLGKKAFHQKYLKACDKDSTLRKVQKKHVKYVNKQSRKKETEPSSSKKTSKSKNFIDPKELHKAGITKSKWTKKRIAKIVAFTLLVGAAVAVFVLVPPAFAFIAPAVAWGSGALAIAGTAAASGGAAIIGSSPIVKAALVAAALTTPYVIGKLYKNRNKRKYQAVYDQIHHRKPAVESNDSRNSAKGTQEAPPKQRPLTVDELEIEYERLKNKYNIEGNSLLNAAFFNIDLKDKNYQKLLETKIAILKLSIPGEEQTKKN